MIDRFLSAFVAVCLALLIWLYARSRDQEALNHVPIPVEVALGPAQAGQYSLEIAGPSQVLASFSGSPSRIRELRTLIQRDQLRIELNYTVPADRLKENRLHEALLIEPAQLRVPPGVTANLLPGRNQVQLVLFKLGEKQLTVRIDQSLETEAGAYQVEPASVRVRGPLELLERKRTIPTQPWVLPDPSSRTPASVPLVRELEGRPVKSVPETVKVLVAAKRKTYELTDIPIHFLTPTAFPFRPRLTGTHAGSVTLRIIGPVQEEPPQPYVFIDLTGKAFTGLASLKMLKPLAFEEPVQMHLPRGFQLEDGPSRPIPFELVPLAGASSGH